MKSIRVIKADTQSVIIGTDVPYAQIHNEGGISHPVVSKKMKKFAWAMYYQNAKVMKKTKDFKKL
jgi:phage gpG-like protein